MRRKKTYYPLSPYAWLAEAGWVFAVHSAQLWADPAKAGKRLMALGIEKQLAFAEGTVKAGAAMMRGASPAGAAAASLVPAKRSVKANARKIRKGK